MGVKKLHTVFMRYVLLLALTVLLVISVNMAFYLFGVEKGVIYPLNKVSNAIESSKEQLQTVHQVELSDIPALCEFALFSTDGQYKSGSLEQEESAALWKKCVENEQTSENPYFYTPYLYTVINRGDNDEVLILRYRTAAQFYSPALRNIFPSADVVLVVLILLEILISLAAISVWFGKYLGKRIDKLLTAVQKIEQQDLDFEVEKSKLFEIDRVLNALDHMKLALKQSLVKQWQDDKMRQDQLSALAHDLKTPLTIIRGNTELLLDTSLSTEQKECTEYIETSSLQMQNYVQTLIEVTKSWDNYQLCMQSISINLLLQEVKKQISGLCSIENISIRWSCNQQSEYFTVDHDLLVRALINVLSNAVEHTPAGGAVSLEVQENDGYLCFIVSDTGKGFSKDALKHATEQFYMEDSSRHEKSHYGIGLYLANSVIQKHGGKLILDNSAEIGGAKVTIQIPC